MSTELSEIAEDESKRLAELEEIIEQDLPAFVRVGNALIEIHERQLYRGTHANLKEYLADRWPNLSFVHAYRIMKATKTLELLGPAVSSEIGELQLRALGELPEEMRSAAWERACLESGGEPTSAKVQEVVNDILGKDYQYEFRKPEEPDDGPKYDETAERQQEWLDSLPLNLILEGLQLKRFRYDAMLWKKISRDRGRLRNTISANLHREDLHGSYMRAILAPLKIQSPEHWLVCPPSSGCGGKGILESGARCKRCSGSGFWFNGYKDH